MRLPVSPVWSLSAILAILLSQMIVSLWAICCGILPQSRLALPGVLCFILLCCPSRRDKVRLKQLGFESCLVSRKTNTGCRLPACRKQDVIDLCARHKQAKYLDMVQKEPSGKTDWIWSERMSACVVGQSSKQTSNGNAAGAWQCKQQARRCLVRSGAEGGSEPLLNAMCIREEEARRPLPCSSTACRSAGSVDDVQQGR